MVIDIKARLCVVRWITVNGKYITKKAFSLRKAAQTTYWDIHKILYTTFGSTNSNQSDSFISAWNVEKDTPALSFTAGVASP